MSVDATQFIGTVYLCPLNSILDFKPPQSPAWTISDKGSTTQTEQQGLENLASLREKKILWFSRWIRALVSVRDSHGAHVSGV